MALFVVRRGIGAIATFLAATAIVFTITFALPGDVARTIAGNRQASPATLAAIRERYGLDDPLPVRYLNWLGRLLRGDLGESFASRRPVSAILLDALPVTATLLLLTILIEAVAGLVIGASAAVRRGRRFDHATVVGCALAIAVPLFVVGSISQDLAGVRLGLLPVAGTTSGITSYLLPALTLALPGAAIAVRLMRAEATQQLRAPHVRTARAKGIPDRAVTRRHVVRNSLVPFVSFIGLEVGALAGGAIVVERVFNLPGVGLALARAISQRDNALIVGFTMAIVAVYLVVDLVVDVVTMLLDPRIEVAA